MPAPTLTAAWPVPEDLEKWLAQSQVAAATLADLIPDVLDEAGASILERIDTDKLPTDPEACPRVIRRAIILEAARLLYRRQSIHGAAAFGDVAIRLRSVDVDVERLIHPYRVDPEP